MGRKTFFYLFTLLFSVFVGVIEAFADGLLLAEPGSIPGPVKAPAALSVKKHLVTVRIESQVATTRVDQVFVNGFDADVEATYLFPLPEKAAVSNFSLTINGKKTGGQVLEREQARKIYEEIVRKMKDPGLLEYAGRNLFRARVYPVPARAQTRIELVYSEALAAEGGVTRYVYPFDTERFSPLPIEELGLSVHVSSAVPIKSVYSPSHDIDVRLQSREADAGFEQRGVKPDRDFVLYYSVSERDLGMSLLTYRAPGEDGFFLLMLSPGQVEGPTLPKDVVFVLDTSGSMRGEKLEQAKRALRFCLEGLGEHDRFNVVQFATGVSPFRTGLAGLAAAGNDAVGSALAFVERLEARGGTNIGDALLTALRMFPAAGRASMVVFLTDGEPTVGATETADILKILERENRARARVFVFGVGYDVNTHLLDGIAAESRGFSDYLAPSGEIERAVSSFFRKVSKPVLSDTALQIGGVEVFDLFPSVLPDLFSGQQVFAFGRYRGEGETAVAVAGTVDGRVERFVSEGAFPARSLGHDFIPRLWASRKIGYLIDEIRLHGENKELIDEIVLLSTEHGIVTPYTSYLVLEEKGSLEQLGMRPEEAPSVRSEGMKLAKAMEDRTGEASVAAAKDLKEMKGRSVLPGFSAATVKHVGAKTFYLKGGAWVDSAYREGMITTNLLPFSGAYFELLKRAPELAKYLAISKNLVVVHGSACYRISD
jgi:Ca-activated chloride channel family protein